MIKKLTFVKRDENEMPIYRDQDGQLWIDIDCRKGRHELYTYDPEEGPDLPMDGECIYIGSQIEDPANKIPKMVFFM